MTTYIGWCHVCGRDIAKTDDHALGCAQSGLGPRHPQIRPLTLREVRAELRPLGWRLTGNREIGYVLVSLPDYGDVSEGPFDTPADALAAAQLYNATT